MKNHSKDSPNCHPNLSPNIGDKPAQPWAHNFKKGKLKWLSWLLMPITCINLLQFQAQAKEEEKKLKDDWKQLSDCRLLDNESNDGDSFHVKHLGKEYVFRLYLADCPETNLKYMDRNIEQIKEFGAPLEKILATGKIAAEVTKKLLARPFTVITKGEDARGESKLGRSYAFVKTSDGADLGELLVSQGLARSHGKDADAPKVRPDLQEKYDRLSQKAKRLKIGAWGDKDIKLDGKSTVSNGDIIRAKREAELLQNEKKDDVENLSKYLGIESNKKMKTPYYSSKPSKPSKPYNNNSNSDAKTNIDATITSKTPPIDSNPSSNPNQQKVIQKHNSIFYETIEDDKSGDPSPSIFPTLEMDTDIFNTPSPLNE